MNSLLEAPHIISRKPVLRAVMPAGIVGVQGWYDIYLIDKESGNTKKHLSFPNMILDVGLAQLVMGTSLVGDNTTSLAHECVVGSGSTPPAATDTGLVSEVASTSNNASIGDVSSSGPEFSWRQTRRSRVFETNEANGNLSEVGFRQGSSGQVFLSRQLMRDDLGDPTTITKTSNELLRVDYSVRVYAHVLTNQQSVQLSIESGGWDPQDFAFEAYTRGVEVSREVTGSSFLRSWQRSRIVPIPAWSYGARAGNSAGLFDWNTTGVTTHGWSSHDQATVIGQGTAPDHYEDREFMWDLGSGNFSAGLNHFAWGGVNGPMFNTWVDQPIPKTNVFRLKLIFRKQVQRVAW